MALPALACALVTFGATRVAFRRELADVARTMNVAPTRLGAEFPTRAFDTTARFVLVALAAVVLAYPVVSWFGGPVWLVAAVGAVVLLAIAARAGTSPVAIARDEVHLDTLVFLVAALVLSIGLRNAGLVAWLARMYDGASPLRIGVVCAVGSAVLNNHPMSHLNMFALAAHDGAAGHTGVFAALIGGDLGPRLFPIGSLAGLLWIEMLRRAGVEMSARRFLLVGAVSVPALCASLALLR